MTLTPRRMALVDVLNLMFARSLAPTEDNIIGIMSEVAKNTDKSERGYLINITPRAEKKFICDVNNFLGREIILDYTDFEPGGRYKGNE